jgi:hypothetical protein
MNATTTLAEDVAYLRGLGLEVYPAKVTEDENGDKVVDFLGIKWQDRTNIDFARYPQANVPYVRVPVGYAVLDIDDIEKFKAAGFAVPEDVKYAYSRKGAHLYFRTDGREVPQVVDPGTTGYDTRVGGKGIVFAWNPMDIPPLDDWVNAPEFMYHKPAGKPTAPGEPAAPMTSRNDILSLLGKVAQERKMPPEFYYDMLAGMRDRGELVATKAEPWSDDVLSFLAREASEKFEPAVHGTLITRNGIDVRTGVPDRPADSERSGNLAGALDAATAVLRRYVHFTKPEQVWAVVLWAAATHRASDFSLLPRLAIRAPTRQSGKTRLLEVLSELVRDGWMTVGPSAPALYRKIEAAHPTILLDEVDRLFSKRTEDTAPILEVLNAGHTNGATVPRVIGIGTKQTVHDFPVYSPVALAGIAANWPDTVLDRSIIITMERRRADEPIDRYRMEHHSIPRAAGVQLELNVRSAELPRVELPEHLSDRAQDNWEPLFRIAEAAGGEWPERARLSAAELGSAAAVIMAADERTEVLLLGDIIKVFEADPDITFIGSKDLLTRLLDMDASQWADWSGHGGFTTTRMGRYMAILGIHSSTPWTSPKRGYLRSAVEEVWARVGDRNQPGEQDAERSGE